MENNRNFRRPQVPVKVGDEVDVTIEGIGEKGDGFARVNGFVLFIKDVQKDERCKVRVSRVLAKVGFADKIGEATSEPEESEEETSEDESQDSDDFGSEDSDDADVEDSEERKNSEDF